MKQLKSILLITGVLYSLALGIQTHASGLFPIKEVQMLAKSVKISNSIPKKDIDLNTGIRMKYREAGNPNGRTMLLIHGYTDTSSSFERVMEKLLLVNPDLRVIAPDLRGHGESSMPTPSTTNSFEVRDFAEDLLDFMRLKNITKVDLVGHSMGSVIAQEIALEHPDKVASLTMIGAFINGKKNSAIQDFLMPELISKWEWQLKEKFGEDWKIKSFTLTPKDLGAEATSFLKNNWVTDADSKASLLESIYLETIEIPLATWIGALRALSEVDNASRMNNLKTPTLIIWGSGDELTIKQDQDKLLEACENANRQNATRIYFRNYQGDDLGNKKPGHNLHWGNASQVASDILEFMFSSDPFEIKTTKIDTRNIN